MMYPRLSINLYWVILLIPIIHALATVFTPYFASLIIHPGTIRGFVVICFLLIILPRRYERNFPNLIILAYLIYCLMLVLMQSSDLLGALYGYMRILLWALMFPLGYYFFTSIETLRRLNIVFLLVLWIFIIEVTLSNLLGYGVSNYAVDSFSYGAAGVNMTKTMALILLMAPVFLSLSRNQPTGVFMLVSFAVAGVFILVGLKRSALAALIVGTLLYMILSPMRGRAFSVILGLFVIGVLTSPLYLETLLERFDARKEAIEEITSGDITEEGRFNADVMPAIMLWWEGSLKHKLFGSEIFFPAKVTGGRNMHVDYARVLVGSGLIGMLLFFLIYGAIAYEMHSYFYIVRENPLAREIYAVFWALMIASLIMGYAGTVMGIELRAHLFFYWGAMIGVIRQMALSKLSSVDGLYEKDLLMEKYKEDEK